jgi:hypothetical protein
MSLVPYLLLPVAMAQNCASSRYIQRRLNKMVVTHMAAYFFAHGILVYMSARGRP